MYVSRARRRAGLLAVALVGAAGLQVAIDSADAAESAAHAAARAASRAASAAATASQKANDAQDDRATVQNLAITDNARLKTAAETALQGTDADVVTFIQTQAYPNRFVDDRIKVNQVATSAKAAGNTLLANAAQAALDANNDQAFRAFLDSGQFMAAQTGQRVLVNNILASVDSGPETKAAAQVALSGPPSAITEFLDTGRYTAAGRDADTASHLAIVDG